MDNLEHLVLWVTTMFQIFCVLMLQNLLMLGAIKKESSALLGKAVVSNMIVVSAFGAQLVDLGFGVINVGTIVYASVVAMQYVIFQHAGAARFKEVLAATSIGVLVFPITMLMLMSLPAVTDANAYSAVFKSIRNVALPSFWAFFVSQVALYWALQKFHTRWFGYPLAILLCQTIDSLAFFLVAFAQNPMWPQLLVDGLITKVIVGLTFWPVVQYVVRKAKLAVPN